MLLWIFSTVLLVVMADGAVMGKSAEEVSVNPASGFYSIVDLLYHYVYIYRNDTILSWSRV